MIQSAAKCARCNNAFNSYEGAHALLYQFKINGLVHYLHLKCLREIVAEFIIKKHDDIDSLKNG